MLSQSPEILHLQQAYVVVTEQVLCPENMAFRGYVRHSLIYLCFCTKGKRRVIAAGESLMCGMEAPICHTDLKPLWARCSPGAQPWDSVESLLRLVCLFDCHLLLQIPLSTPGTARVC